MSHHQAAYDTQQRLEEEFGAVDRLLEKMSGNESRGKRLNPLRTQLQALHEADDNFENGPAP
jgi:hypothetical protein